MHAQGSSSPVRHIEMFSRQNKENLPGNQSGGLKKPNQKKPYRGKETSLRHKLGFEQLNQPTKTYAY